MAEATFQPVWSRRLRALLERPSHASYAVGQLLFGRALALVCLVAFGSLWVQVDGLYGPHGILPIEDFLADGFAWAQRTGRAPQLIFPSVFWFTGAGSATLHAACAVGIVAATALFFGILSRLSVATLWVTYLSFASTGQVFMGYQWDVLLLEALFVGFFFVPWSARISRTVPRLTAGRWLVWLLVAKLMLLSGYVKLISDPAWSDLTALNYHLWTQPIPNVVAWYADKLPDAAKAVGVLFTLVAETAAPLTIFAPRRLRHAGAMLMIGLQLGIMATGTYGFFNLLTIALCLTLFDDDAFGRWRGPVAAAATRPDRRLTAATLALLAPLVGLASQLPQPVRDVVAPLRTFNTYGLFATMTRERPEVIVEWSDDGERWTAYDFAFKPTAPAESLRATTFHMPRLDWQMWFAALLGCERSPWIRPFAVRLLEASPEVHGLLAGDLPDRPPRLVRMRLFQYRFGEDQTWARHELGEFCPTFALDETGALVKWERR